MTKAEIIKTRCTEIQKQYLIEFMHHNRFKRLSEALRDILDNHMIINQTGGARNEK